MDNEGRIARAIRFTVVKRSLRRTRSRSSSRRPAREIQAQTAGQTKPLVSLARAPPRPTAAEEHGIEDREYRSHEGGHPGQYRTLLGDAGECIICLVVMQLSMTPRAEIRAPVQIVNVFARVDFGTHLDLEKLARRIPSAEYDPENLSGLIVRTKAPRACITIFSSGVARCTGSRSANDAMAAVSQVANLLREANLRFQNPSIEIRNVVGVSEVRRKIDLVRFSEAAAGIVEYEPDLFPGAVFRQRPRGSVLVFGNGKVIITGVKNLEEAEMLREHLNLVLQRSRC